MKVAYFDCEFGAAGDMLVGSLLSAGASVNHVIGELEKLGLSSDACELGVEDVIRCSIACKKFNVLLGIERLYETGLFPASSSESSPPAALCNQARNSEDSGETLSGGATDSGTVAGASTTPETSTLLEPSGARFTKLSQANKAVGVAEKQTIAPGSLAGILQLLEASGLTDSVKHRSAEIIEKTFRAECLYRGMSVDEMQMNPWMALDLIIDVVSFCVSYDSLGIEKSYVSPLPLGFGTFTHAGITYSGAAPATISILKDAAAPISDGKFQNECLTVTGAAILSSIASGWSRPAFDRIIGVGYGAGSYDPLEYPNACRVLIGVIDESMVAVAPELVSEFKRSDGKFRSEGIIVLEANIDDLAPQSLAYAMERLFDAGALDVLVLPAVMKKGRSGHLLKVLSSEEHAGKLQALIFSETSTIGVRSYLATRAVADRTWQEVRMDDGTSIRVKIALDSLGTEVNAQPEYEDCAAYAIKHNVPLKNVVLMVMTRFKAESQDRLGK